MLDPFRLLVREKEYLRCSLLWKSALRGISEMLAAVGKLGRRTGPGPLLLCFPSHVFSCIQFSEW
jgi:hypothetical protein